ncbi:MAG: hypothetical protein GY880_18660 [Planctomycetaceae bacterium]|nr:hypothetical protein [Planctomycetaceae bacterium]
MRVLFLNCRFLVFILVSYLAFFASDVRNLRGEDDFRAVELRQTAEQVERSAESLKDEIKANFKGSKKYGKLLSVVAKIKSRSAGWIRKVDRNADYRLPARDVEKIKNLAYELSSEYDAAIEYSRLGKGRPVQGSTVLAADQISILISLTEQLQFASYTPSGIGAELVSEPLAVPELLLVSPVDSEFGEAPGRPVSGPGEPIRREPETSTAPEPAMQSVWEK